LSLPGWRWAFGAFLGDRLGALAALRAGAWLVRPLIIVASRAMALRLMAAGQAACSRMKLASHG